MPKVELSKSDNQVFDSFARWVMAAQWVQIPAFECVKEVVRSLDPVPLPVWETASEILFRITENLKLQPDTRRVLENIKYQIDMEIEQWTS